MLWRHLKLQSGCGQRCPLVHLVRDLLDARHRPEYMTFCRFRTSFSVLEAPVPDLSGKGVGWNPESGLGSRSELHELPFLDVVPDSDMTF